MTSVALAGRDGRRRSPRLRASACISADVRFFRFAKPGPTYAALVGPTETVGDSEVGGGDAAVPVGSWGIGARAGGRARGCGPEQRVGGASTLAVSGDRLCRQHRQ